MSKRPRTNSEPNSIKASRLTQHSNIFCSLPPTCINSPTLLYSSIDLESHYAKFHAHVCEQPSCACVFPDQRLLELHQTECHDPIAALRKDRGEKIFACHLSSCPRLFSTPKTRRLHLIQAHAFPKEFFFAVTNKGVGGLLKRWGEGASMIRGEWTPREGDRDLEGDRDMEGDSGSDDDDISVAPPPNEVSPSLDALTSSMNSLSLVPPSIRFGRGGKNGGFVHRGGSPAHQNVIERTPKQRDVDPLPPDAAMPIVDDRVSSGPNPATPAVQVPPAHRGRGAAHPRGRGRRFPPARGGGGPRPAGAGRGGGRVDLGGPARGVIARGGCGGRGRRGAGRA